MRFPVHPEKHHFEAIYGAQEIVHYRKQVGRMPALENPEGILFCLERGLPHRMRWRIPVKRVGGMNGDFYALKKPPGKIGIMTGFGGGSPMTVELAEEFVAMGARRLVLITWGGMLQPEMKAGDIVVVDRAIRDEGASYHYLPPGRYAYADPALAERLVDGHPPARRSLHPGYQLDDRRPLPGDGRGGPAVPIRRGEDGGDGSGRVVHRRAGTGSVNGCSRGRHGQPGGPALARS
jgi:hypothetical protein